VSDFFDVPVPPPPEPPEPRRPEWFGPPDNVIGVTVPLGVTLVRTDDLALAAPGATAYPTGIAFEVVLLLREQVRDPLAFHPFHMFHGGAREEALRLGVQFSDGRKATSLESRFPHEPNERPSGPLLMPHGGGGGGRRWDVSFWLWPLPPAGTLELVCEWPARGIPLRRVSVDSDRLLEAASQAAPLWPDGGGSDGGSMSVTTFTRK
jgi:hypothetical protein